MAHRRWHSIVGLTAISTLTIWTDVLARDQDAAPAPAIVARVRLDDRAGVGASTLERAKARTDDVFRLAGLAIEWIDTPVSGRESGATVSTVLIMADAPPEMKAAAGQLGDGLMGQAAPSAGRAYVYYDRVVAETVPLRGVAITLGDVVAHELGHLLLPPGHSSKGIMRSRIDRTDRRVETFTDAQIAAITRRLHGDERPTAPGPRRIEASVLVRVDNDAAVPAGILRFAEARAAEVYEQIGVRLTWIDGQDAIREYRLPPYTVVLQTPEQAAHTAAQLGVNDGVVGTAAMVVRRAYVYYERVVEMSLPPERDVVTLLGDVIAHEVGHLMLPPQSHAQTGIMRARFDLNSRLIETFTDFEATAIRDRVRHDMKTWNSEPRPRP